MAAVLAEKLANQLCFAVVMLRACCLTLFARSVDVAVERSLQLLPSGVWHDCIKNV